MQIVGDASVCVAGITVVRKRTIVTGFGGEFEKLLLDQGDIAIPW
jgi:hypothetical protein